MWKRDRDYSIKMSRSIAPAYLRQVGRRGRFKYVFTRSSYNVIDLSFRLYHDFLYSSLSSYFEQQEKKIYIFIASGQAVPGPPLGSILAQHGIGTATFCKRFNARTKSFGFAIIVRVVIDWGPGRSGGGCEFQVEAPSASFFVGGCLDYSDLGGRHLPEGFVLFSEIVQMAIFKFPKLELEISCRVLVGTVLSAGATVWFDL